MCPELHAASDRSGPAWLRAIRGWRRGLITGSGRAGGSRWGQPICTPQPAGDQGLLGRAWACSQARTTAAMSGGNPGAVTWHPNPEKKGESGGSDPRLLESWGSRWLPQPLVSRDLGLVSGRCCAVELVAAGSFANPWHSTLSPGRSDLLVYGTESVTARKRPIGSGASSPRSRVGCVESAQIHPTQGGW
jgi:hypothetical protein